MKEDMLVIDPALKTGWALFKKDSLQPHNCGVLKRSSKGDFFARATQTSWEFEMLIVRIRPSLVVIEWPGNFSGSSGGRAAAASGSIIKLAFIIGMFSVVCTEYACVIEYVPVNKWKGQLKKPLVIKRIKDRLPKQLLSRLDPKDDAWDAIGIGLYVKGLF